MHPARLRYLRRWYFMGLILALTLLLVIRFFAIGQVGPGASAVRSIAAQILESLIAASVAGAFIAILLMWLLPAEDRAPEMSIVEQREIEPLIQAECLTSREWLIRARTASYFKSKTLPSLAGSASSRNMSISVHLQIMDPTDKDLQSAYMRYFSTRDGISRKWSGKRVRNEIFATILSVYAWREVCPRLELEIGLSSSFWIMSIDISQQWALITGQYRGHPAVKHQEGTAFYNTYRDEFEAGLMNCRILDPTVRSPKPDELDVPSIKEMLDKLKLDRSEITTEDYKSINQYIRRPEHRYE